jgi:predicted phage tail protein
MGKITATCIENIFDPHNSQKIKQFKNGTSIGEIVSHFNPVLCSDLEVVASIDGVVLNDADIRAIVPKDGSSVVFSIVPKGGGGGKSPLKLVALLAVSVLSFYAPGLMPGLVNQLGVGLFNTGMFSSVGSALAMAGTIISGATTLLGGILISAVFGSASLPSFDTDAGLNSSATYAWDVKGNPTEQGITLPILYGRTRITPPIINEFTTNDDDTQQYNALFAIADHEIDFIGNEYINSNPSSNFEDVIFDYRYGTLDQGVIPAFSDTYSDKRVGFKLSTDWVVSETSGNSVDGIGVGIYFPALYYLTKKGELQNHSVIVNIQYREKGTETWYDFEAVDTSNLSQNLVLASRWSAGYYLPDSKWVELEEGTSIDTAHTEGDRYPSVEGKAYWRWIDSSDVSTPIVYNGISGGSITITAASQDAVYRDFYLYNLDPSQYEIRARFEEEPPTSLSYRNTGYFSYIKEIVYDDFTYPGTALAGIQALATDTLSGSRPAITFEAERTYVFVWTGSAYEQKPANNPAWAAYDILHNSDYGANLPYSKFIYEDFEEWATFCETKNYTCNIYVDQSMSVRGILDTISLLGRGTVVHKGSQYGVIIDKKEDIAVQHFMFTKGNMIENSYTNSFLDLTERANAIEITYFDEELDYSRQIVEIYQDGFDEVQTEINKTSVSLVGCTNRQQAINFGRGMLLRNRYLTQTITFQAGIDSIACLPGQVIEVSYDVPQWGLSSGRLISATSTSVTLPEAVELVAGSQYTVQIKHAEDDTIEYRNVIPVGVTTTTSTLNLVSAWDITPKEYDLYAFGHINNVTKKFRILNITRTNDTLYRTISALEYMDEIYNDALDTVPNIEIGDTAYVTDLNAKESWVFASDGTGKSVIDVSWRGNALSWNVFVKKADGLWQLAGVSTKKSYRIDIGFAIGDSYMVSVTPYNTQNNQYTKSVIILGKEAPPSNVENFIAVANKDAIDLTWDAVEDADFLSYTIVRGVSYETGIPVITSLTENEFSWNPPVSGTYTFWIKAVDRTFNESLVASSTSISVDISDYVNFILERDEITTYVPDGEVYNLFYESSEEVLKWIPGMTYDELAGYDFDTPVLTDYLFFNYDNGYFISDIIDIGTSTTFSLRQALEKTAALIDPSFDDFIYGRTFNTFPRDTFNSITSLAKYNLYYKYSVDNITWSDWYLYSNKVTITARYLQIKAETNIIIKSTSFEISSILSYLDVDDKSKKLYNQTISSGGTEYLLSSIPITIFSAYNVGVTILGSGFATYSVDIQSDRFTVYIYDSSGTGISRDVNLEISGF